MEEGGGDVRRVVGEMRVGGVGIKNRASFCVVNERSFTQSMKELMNDCKSSETAFAA